MLRPRVYRPKFRRRVALFVTAWLTIALAGGYALYQRRDITYRVAVATDGRDARLIGQINDWLSAEGRPFRMRTVTFNSPDEALAMLRDRRADMAALRTDAVSGRDVVSLAVLYWEQGLFLTAPGTGVTTWQGLRGKSLAVMGDKADPLIQALLRAHGVEPALIVDPPSGPIARQARPAALAVVTPNLLETGAALRRLSFMRSGTPDVLDVENPEYLVARDRRYTDSAVAVGAIWGQPALPSEAVTTISVARHLIARADLHDGRAATFARELLNARRALFSSEPLLRQTGAPDTEADAFVRVHNAAKKIYLGDEPTFFDTMIERVYLLPILIGAVGAFGGWLWPKLVDPRARVIADIGWDLVAMRTAIRQASTASELDGLTTELEAIMQNIDPMVHRYESTSDVLALVHAASALEDLIERRRSLLAG